MNELEKKLIIDHAHQEWDELPVAVREQIESSATCRLAWNHSKDMQHLMALKRHEQPAPEVAGRIQFGVRTKLANGETVADDDAGLFAGLAWLKYALGILLVALVGITALIQFEKSKVGENGGGLVGVEQPGLNPENLAIKEPVFTPIPTASSNATPHKANGGSIQFIDNRP